MSQSYCHFIQISNTVPPALPSPCTSLKPATTLTDLFPLVCYFGYLQTHSWAAYPVLFQYIIIIKQRSFGNASNQETFMSSFFNFLSKNYQLQHVQVCVHVKMKWPHQKGMTGHTTVTHQEASQEGSETTKPMKIIPATQLLYDGSKSQHLSISCGF